VTESIYQIAVALIRRGDGVLLVHEQGPHDPEPVWTLPGGMVEPGEMLSEALVREVREETGLAVVEIGTLLYVMHHDNPGYGISFDGTPQGPGFRATAAVFTVARWEGEPLPADPDGLVLDVGFFPLAEAIARLEGLPYRVKREPIVAYLRGEVAAGAVWRYRRRPDGYDELVARLDGHSHSGLPKESHEEGTDR
jgi:8-oxo-dGTP diphosphatase